jgi:hypothetical protein
MATARDNASAGDPRMTVRELVKSYQREIQQTNDLLPDRAAELLMQLTALMGNVNDEIREADSEYAITLLHLLDTEKKANRARIRAEISAEFRRKQEARDTKELVIELTRSLKYFLRAKSEEMQMARHQ